MSSQSTRQANMSKDIDYFDTIARRVAHCVLQYTRKDTIRPFFTLSTRRFTSSFIIQPSSFQSASLLRRLKKDGALLRAASLLRRLKKRLKNCPSAIVALRPKVRLAVLLSAYRSDVLAGAVDVSASAAVSGDAMELISSVSWFPAVHFCQEG